MHGRGAAADVGTAFRGKKVLVTGGVGFIGSNLARRLLELGGKVTLVDSLVPEYGGNLANLQGIDDRLHVNISDLRDEHSMAYLVQGKDVGRRQCHRGGARLRRPRHAQPVGRATSLAVGLS